GLSAHRPPDGGISRAPRHGIPVCGWLVRLLRRQAGRSTARPLARSAAIRHQRAGRMEKPTIDVSGPADADGLAELSNIVPGEAQLGGQAHGAAAGGPDIAWEADRKGSARERRGYPGAHAADRLA